MFGYWVLRRVGSRGAHLGSLIGAVLAVLVLNRPRAGLLDYWRRHRPGSSRMDGLGFAWRQFASFGRIVCDRGLVYLEGMKLRFEQRGADRLGQALGSGKGCILLSAHVGNWELAGRLLSRYAPGVPVNLVKVENEDPRERAIVDAVMGDQAPAVIDPRDSIAASLAIREALDRGEVVGFLGDRAHGQQPTAAVSFFGSPARMPVGPFQVAQMTGAPILRCFMMRLGHAHYRLEVDRAITVPRPQSRRARRMAVEAACAEWAARLESQLRRFPFQWHNFYRYWD